MREFKNHESSGARRTFPSRSVGASMRAREPGARSKTGSEVFLRVRGWTRSIRFSSWILISTLLLCLGSLLYHARLLRIEGPAASPTGGRRAQFGEFARLSDFSRSRDSSKIVIPDLHPMERLFRVPFEDTLSENRRVRDWLDASGPPASALTYRPAPFVSATSTLFMYRTGTALTDTTALVPLIYLSSVRKLMRRTWSADLRAWLAGLKSCAQRNKSTPCRCEVNYRGSDPLSSKLAPSLTCFGDFRRVDASEEEARFHLEFRDGSRILITRPSVPKKRIDLLICVSSLLFPPGTLRRDPLEESWRREFAETTSEVSEASHRVALIEAFTRFYRTTSGSDATFFVMYTNHSEFRDAIAESHDASRIRLEHVLLPELNEDRLKARGEYDFTFQHFCIDDCLAKAVAMKAAWTLVIDLDEFVHAPGVTESARRLPAALEAHVASDSAAIRLLPYEMRGADAYCYADESRSTLGSVSLGRLPELMKHKLAYRTGRFDPDHLLAHRFHVHSTTLGNVTSNTTAHVHHVRSSAWSRQSPRCGVDEEGSLELSAKEWTGSFKPWSQGDDWYRHARCRDWAASLYAEAAASGSLP